MDFKKIQELLNPVNGGKKYVIPQYQRAYSWGQSECDQLLNDIEENDEGYFVGSAIAIQSTETDDEIIENMLIDGQQRFTSMSLLLLAIYHLVTNKYKEDFNALPPDNGKKLNVYSVKKCLILLDNNDNFIDYRLTPQIIANNKNDYHYH